MLNFDWYSFCTSSTDKIWQLIKPVIGTKEAAIKVRRTRKFAKKIDVLVEDQIIEQIKKKNLEVNLISEEIGEIEIGSKTKKPKYTIILDPIDGTTNSIRALPFFSTSIAVAKGNRIQDLIFGYIRNYLADEIFYADQNGSYFNNQNCRSSTCNHLNQALISVYSYSYVNYDLIQKIISKIRKMRLFGAVSIELAYIGCGKLDGLIDLRGDLSIYDIAAGILFLNQAGGVISDANGVKLSGQLDMDKGYSIVAASNNNLHSKFIKIIN